MIFAWSTETGAVSTGADSHSAAACEVFRGEHSLPAAGANVWTGDGARWSSVWRVTRVRGSKGLHAEKLDPRAFDASARPPETHAADDAPPTQGAEAVPEPPVSAIPAGVGGEGLGARIREGVPAPEYHAADRESSGSIRAAAESIADWRLAKRSLEETAALLRGRAIHAVFTEPDTVIVDACPDGVIDDGSHDALKASVDGVTDPETGKAVSKGGGSAAIVERIRRVLPDAVLLSDVRKGWEDEGRIVLGASEYDRVQRTCDAIRANSRAMYLINSSGSGREVVVEWVERVTVGDDVVEIDCQARLDFVASWDTRDRDMVIVADLKTMGMPPTRGNIAKAVRNYGLDIQAAWNIRALREAGVTVDSYIDLGFTDDDGEPILSGALLICVSTVEPFICEVAPISSAAIDAAEQDIERALRNIAVAQLRPDAWPGYTRIKTNLSRPGMHAPIDVYRKRER